MSSPTKAKKTVHYERGTKQGRHSYKSSRDSGVGTSSSSASDRASLGTTPNGLQGLSYSDIQDQRHILSAVQEALDAANDRIRQLESANSKLNILLSETHKENRLLKREKADLLNKVDDLMDDLEDQKTLNKQLKRSSRDGSSSPRTVVAAPSRRKSVVTPPEYHRPTSSHRQSYTLPMVPQPPHNPNPNPFTPLSERPGGITFPQSQIAYANTNLVYAHGPAFAHAPPSVVSSARGAGPNDGRYHLTPI